MAKRKIHNDNGHELTGGPLEVEDEIKFKNTSNPFLSTIGGGFIWNIITNLITAWVLRDATKGIDIITVDTVNDRFILDPLYTPIGFGGILFTLQSTNYNANSGDWVDMTTGATDKTITFPASPVINDAVKISKADVGVGNIIIDGNGNNINGIATDLITSQYTVVTYQFNGVEWRKY